MLRDEYGTSIQWGGRSRATHEQAEDAVKLVRFRAVPEEVAADDEFVMSLREEVANLNSAAGPELTGRNVARAVNVAGRVSARAKAPECRSCGSAVPSDARFCVMCGNPLGGQ